MTFGSLFAGIGGLDLGLTRAGMECRWQVEIDPFCCRVLEQHWPGVPRWGDIRDFPPGPGDGLAVDMICGGFPCTQISTAAAVHGRRVGLAGEDSGLWWEMHRVVQRLRPRWVLVENVAGVSAWAAEIEGSLEGSGYTVSRLPLAAGDFGAPHRRRREFFVADLGGTRLSLPRSARSSSPEGQPGRDSDRNPWLQALPGVLRVADGVPGGLDRRRRIVALGNAVVPQVAEFVGRLIAGNLVTTTGGSHVGC